MDVITLRWVIAALASICCTCLTCESVLLALGHQPPEHMAIVIGSIVSLIVGLPVRIKDGSETNNPGSPPTATGT